MMTSTFSSKKASKISMRKLGMESLENREMLSVNPLGSPDFAPSDTVQAPAAASQDFSTEAGTAVTIAQTAKTDVSVTISISGGGSGEGYVIQQNTTSATANGWTTVTATGATGNDASAITSATITGLTANTQYWFRVITSDSTVGNSGDAAITGDDTASAVLNVTTNAAAGSTDPSNATVSVSGVTTSAATLTWTKPTSFGTNNDKVGKVINYWVAIDGGTAVGVGTKTTYAVTGLATGSHTYTITADIEDAAKVKHTVAIGTDSIALVAAGSAAAVTVGAPTEVKAAYAKASGTKPASVKVTWKAPANYTGGYTVTLHNVADGTTLTNDIVQTILPGAKLEWTFKTDDTTPIVDATRYSVVVTPTATNKIASTATYVNVGTVPAGTVVAKAAAIAGTADGNIPGGTGIKITNPASVTGIAGYYVGLTTQNAVPTSPNISKLVFVPVGTAGQADSSVHLVIPDTVPVNYAYAITVATDGSLSEGVLSAAPVVTTPESDFAVLPVAEYPAASNVTGIMAGEEPQKNSYRIEWTNAKSVLPGNDTSASISTLGEFAYLVKGFKVTATIDGGLTVVQTAYNGVTGIVFANLNWGTKCDFKVETLIDKVVGDGSTDWSTLRSNSTNITDSISAAAASKTVTIAKAPTVAAPTKADTPFTSDGLSATVNWKKATTGVTQYKVEVVDANKAVIGSAVVGDVATIDIGKSTSPAGLQDTDFVLTPGAKYTVNVYSVGAEPGAVSKALAVSVTATPFVTGTVKDAKETTINSVTLTVEAPKTGAGTGDKYYVEYTNVVDAKGKPDWDAATVYSAKSTVTGGADTPLAVAAGADITISHLTPGSQYYFRVVTVNEAWVTSTAEWDDMTKSVAGKEIKVKTVVVPLATVAKNGYSVTSGGEFGLKVAGNTMQRVDGFATKQILTPLTSPAYIYTLLVSTDSKVDKATGKLNGARTALTPLTVTTANTTSADKKVTDLSGEVDFSDIFTALGITSANFSGVKGLNVQIQVDVSYGTPTDTFTSYSKVSKVALPKWFV